MYFRRLAPQEQGRAASENPRKGTGTRPLDYITHRNRTSRRLPCNIQLLKYHPVEREERQPTNARDARVVMAMHAVLVRCTFHLVHLLSQGGGSTLGLSSHKTLSTRRGEVLGESREDPAVTYRYPAAMCCRAVVCILIKLRGTT